MAGVVFGGRRLGGWIGVVVPVFFIRTVSLQQMYTYVCCEYRILCCYLHSVLDNYGGNESDHMGTRNAASKFLFSIVTTSKSLNILKLYDAVETDHRRMPYFVYLIATNFWPQTLNWCMSRLQNVVP